jgi:hypothetical protein
VSVLDSPEGENVEKVTYKAAFFFSLELLMGESKGGSDLNGDNDAGQKRVHCVRIVLLKLMRKRLARSGCGKG